MTSYLIKIALATAVRATVRIVTTTVVKQAVNKYLKK